METKSDWACLPDRLLDSIIKKLNDPADYLRFGCVCKHWLSVATDQDKYKMIRFSKVPMLMIPTNDSSTERRSFYNVIDGKTIYGAELPIPFNRRCCGSSHGWLAFAMDDVTIILFNPLSGKRIDLPRIPIKKFAIYECPYYVRKVVLSADPHTNPDEYEVVAIYGVWKKLAVIKAGQKRWNLMHKKMVPGFLASDVTYYRGLICAVSFFNRLMRARIVLIDTTNKRITMVANQNIVCEGCHRSYLSESSTGELLMIARSIYFGPDIPTSTLNFQVYSVDIDGKGKNSSKLKKVDNLGDDAVFLGDNQSVSILTSDFTGCRANSIYFTDDCIDFFYSKGIGELGIFNLKDESFETHYIQNPLHQRMPPPIWIRFNPNKSYPIIQNMNENG